MNEDEKLKGYVVAFDDITDLVSAQRSAAWGDVARRIAHETKNRLRRYNYLLKELEKFSPLLNEDSTFLNKWLR